MKTAKDYYCSVVMPAYEIYHEIEDQLTTAAKGGDPASIEKAQNRARAAGMGAIVAMSHVPDYQFTEMKANPAQAGTYPSLAALRTDLIQRSKWIGVVTDVADADKHSVLNNPNRYVLSATGTIVTQAGYGQLGSGEGKYGGEMQVVVAQNNGTEAHALSFILYKAKEFWDPILG